MKALDSIFDTNGVGRLREALEVAKVEEGCSLDDLTVLAPQNDPFRVDTPAGHRDGSWLAMVASDLGLGDRTIHLRGLHYMVIDQPKPDGTPYTNTDRDWLWLSAVAGKAARWLGYLPFDQIVDQRNAAPIIRRFKEPDPKPYLNIGVDIDIPNADELVPRIGLREFTGTQPYKLVFFGEKSSLEPVLDPIADQFHADLYLPTGEISDTLLYQMASNGLDDGRPMVVFTFSDCDPAGWQMPISIAQKLRAFESLGIGAPEFQVHRVALTPDHVRTYGLPSTPLKETERRGDKWQAAQGVAQTEIDALATLQPDLLREIAINAVSPYFDPTLARRVLTAKSTWIVAAQAVVDAQTDPETMERIRVEATERLEELASEIENLNDALQIGDLDDFDLPEIVIPTAEIITELHALNLPLVDSRWSFADQARALKASKAYENR